MHIVGAAIVTGAGSGIGRACAIRLATDGYPLVLNDISADRLDETIALLDGHADGHVGDVGDERAVDELVSLALQRHDRLDVMVNNAGYGRPGTVEDTDDELLDEMVRVNGKGVLHGMRSALRPMKAQGNGSIVNIASTAGLFAAHDRAAYGAAKSLVLALTRSAAVENGRFGIRVNAICPGPVLTPAMERFVPDPELYVGQLPMKRMGTPEEVAAVVAFLAGPDSTYVSGVALLVDGAMGARLGSPVLAAGDLTA